jgi:hypothetical protein
MSAGALCSTSNTCSKNAKGTPVCQATLADVTH